MQKVAKSATIDETNPYLRQGNDDDWESYNQNSYNRQDKYKWLDKTYKNFADGARQELDEMQNTMDSAKRILNHTNIAEGNLQMYQAQVEMKIALVDVDSHNFPNLVLMKLSAWHKKLGDEVTLMSAETTFIQEVAVFVLSLKRKGEKVIKSQMCQSGGTGRKI